MEALSHQPEPPTNETTIYQDGDIQYLTDIPLDFSTNDNTGFSEQIILTTDLDTIGLVGKTIIGIKYIFKNCLSNASTFTLDNQKLSIKYTDSTYYDNTYQESTQSSGTSNIITDHVFSLVLDNINEGAVEIDTTPQDFYIYFDNQEQFVLEASKNIVIIWANEATYNSNYPVTGGMFTLVNHLNSTQNESFKVYTYYPDKNDVYM